MQGVPSAYQQDGVLLCKRSWLESVLSEGRVPADEGAFPVREDLEDAEVKDLLSQGKKPLDPNNDWRLLRVERFSRRKDVLVTRIGKEIASCQDSDEMCFAEAARYVAHSNHINTWKEAYKRFGSHLQKQTSKIDSSESRTRGLPHDQALLQLLLRVHGCPLILQEGLECPPEFLAERRDSAADGSVTHVSSALAVVLQDSDVFVIGPLVRHTLRDALTFSPSFLSDSTHKLLFVAYQVLHAFGELHAKDLCMGDIGLHDICISNQLFVSVRPRLTANLVVLSESPRTSELVLPSFLSESTANLLQSAWDGDHAKRDVHEFSENLLGSIVPLWCSGRLSNFDYILLLNYLSGRSFSNPNHYPVMPWVRTFTSEEGGWRDLSRSKYRLNKGDTQLDLTFNSLSELRMSALGDTEASGDAFGAAVTHTPVQPPHHVTDVLSDLTYYVYKSRRTAKAILCKHVRSRWVPAEYPSSMQRLQEWTPDECIPEFYSDPLIFKSVHDDLPDLELPSWCESAEDFVRWHRAALESSKVSEKLHHWLDLTFGYKLSGGSAIRAKNVCLHLVDNHRELRSSGVVQLFASAHPARSTASAYWTKAAPALDASLTSQPDSCAEDSDDADEISVESERASSNRLSWPLSTQETPEKASALGETTCIALPPDFDPLKKLSELETMNSFAAKHHAAIEQAPAVAESVNATKDLATRRVVRDMQVVGCLLLELFMPKSFVTLGRHASLKSRFNAARIILGNEATAVPMSIRATVRSLLEGEFHLASSDRYASVSDATGLPPPSAFQLASPLLSTLPVPKHFAVFEKIVRVLRDVDGALWKGQLACRNENDRGAMEQNAGEFKVKIVSTELLRVLPDLDVDAFVPLLPTIVKLFRDSSSAVMAAWHLFEPVSRLLGRRKACEKLLPLVVALYEPQTHTCKHLKLYHRTFLQFLIVRFGTRTFLRYFSTYLIEAAGGYKDYDDDVANSARAGLQKTWLEDSEQRGNGVEPNASDDEDDDDDDGLRLDSAPPAEREMFDFDSISLDEEGIEFAPAAERPSRERSGNPGSSKKQIYIPPVSSFSEARDASSGPSSRSQAGNISQVAAESSLWLAHRLGPVLTARFISRNLLRMLNLCYMSPESLVSVGERHPDHRVRVSCHRLHGDVLSQSVLDCLTEIVALYGDQVILLQYLQYVWDLVSVSKRKMTPNLEGGLIGSQALLHRIIPYLSDSTLMNELPDNLLSNILFPVLQVITSRSVVFSNGWQSRQCLLYRFLDVVYLIGLRIGEEMSRSHLTSLASALFSSFDKVYGMRGDIPFQHPQHVVEDLSCVLTAESAYAAYVAFYNLFGRAHLDASLINMELIRSLCLRHQEKGATLPRPATFACLRMEHHQDPSPSPRSYGNKIDVSSLVSPTSSNDATQEELNLLIQKAPASPVRHLRSNWLAYWEHEIGRSENDSKFNLKQIRLQTFSGHSAVVRSLFVMDNENSFLSASRDRCVKAWSIRSQGDGGASVGPQWTYSAHKKSVFAVSFLDRVGTAVSCDGNVHVFDPFVGQGVHVVDLSRVGLAQAMAAMPSPSAAVLVASQDPHAQVRLIDCRVGNVAVDLKVGAGSAGLVRSLSASLDGSYAVVGHTSGWASVVDIRTGKIRQSFKAHEGEIMNIIPVDSSTFVTTSLDQVVSVWSVQESRAKCSMSSAQEPIHCAALLDNNFVVATTSNRIMIRHGLTSEAGQFHSNKLRADMLRGNLSSLAPLSMNRLLLLGQDSGNITLLC